PRTIFNTFEKGNKMSEQEMVGGDTLQEMPSQRDFKESCFDLRGNIEGIKLNVQILKADSAMRIMGSPDRPIDLPEILANLQLAYRHLEDAHMRLGKAVQAYDGGESCYPR
ncbi:unnamed protein product, partial [marine sediment metagenome]